MVNIRKRVISGSFWSILSKAVQVGTALLSVPLTLQYLGAERMGLWRLTISMLAIISLINAGLIPHIKTRMAETFAEKNDCQFVKYSSTGILIGLIVLLVGPLAALLASFVDWVGLMRVTDPIARQETLPLVMTIVVCSFAQVGTSFIPAVFDARMQVSKPRIYDLIGNVAGFLLMLLGIHLRVSLPLLAALIVMPGILLRLPMVAELFRIQRAIIIPDLRTAKQVFRELKHPALLAVGIQCGSVALSAAPNFIVVRTLSLTDVTQFSICYQLATLPLAAIAVVVPVFWPAFTMLWRSGERQKVGRWLFLICCGTVAACVAFTIGLGIAGPWFIRMWTHGMIDPARSLLLLLGLFVIVQGVLYWLSTFMWSLNELRIQLVTQAASAVILVIMGYLLSLSFGLCGIAIAMSTALSVGALVPMGWWSWELITGRVKSASKTNQCQNNESVPAATV